MNRGKNKKGCQIDILLSGAERARTVDLLRDRQAF